MEGYKRGRVHHSRILSVESLEDRSLLSASLPPLSVPAPPLLAESALPASPVPPASNAVRGAPRSGEPSGLSVDGLTAATDGHERLEAHYRESGSARVALPGARAEAYERLESRSVWAEVEASAPASQAGGRLAGSADDGARSASAAATSQPPIPATIVDPIRPPLPVAMAREADGVNGFGLWRPSRPADTPSAALVPPATDLRGEGTALGAGDQELLPPQFAGSAAPFALKAAALLDGALAFDFPVLQQGIDDFFAHLGALNGAADDAPESLRFGPWIVLVSVAGFELARRWRTRSPREAFPGDMLLGFEPFVPGADQ